MEELYAEYARREYVSPDPLEFLYRYEAPEDREVVGLIASSLAYGRVASILASVGKVLDALGPSPARMLREGDMRDVAARLSGFRHRFSGAEETAAFLCGIGQALREHGSLEELFGHSAPRGAPILEQMDAFARGLLEYARLPASHLLPCASRGSACKRLALYMRWMVRRDAVDPGGWRCVRPCDIIVPLDTHMFRIGRGLGFCRRATPDAKAALEITAGFRALRLDDPVRYDFALTRFGIRSGMSVDDLLRRFAERAADAER